MLSKAIPTNRAFSSWKKGDGTVFGGGAEGWDILAEVIAWVRLLCIAAIDYIDTGPLDNFPCEAVAPDLHQIIDSSWHFKAVGPDIKNSLLKYFWMRNLWRGRDPQSQYLNNHVTDQNAMPTIAPFGGT